LRQSLSKVSFQRKHVPTKTIHNPHRINFPMNQPVITKNSFCVCIALVLLFACESFTQAQDRPNVVIIFIDDLGYGDLGCFGSETIETPRIDELATQGIKFTNFYAQTVCGPSRSALLTGRYPVRSLGWSMPESEVTFAERLQTIGYTTGCIGKWDVSNRRAIVERMPNNQGFDYYWGTLGANDGGKVVFHENNESVGGTGDMGSLTKRYTDKGIEFLERNQDKPFLLYLAHTMVHSVIGASPEFKGKSEGGLYGDTVEEIDFNTGRLLDTLDELGLRENTLLIFTSDNGPWSNFAEALGPKHNGAIAWGESGPLRGAKGSSYEGGARVPCIVRWPGKVPAGRVSEALFSTLDIMPTLGTLTGFDLPNDRAFDGVDQTALLKGKSVNGARDHFYYYVRGELQGVRSRNWKLVLPNRQSFYNYVKDRGTDSTELYDLSKDIGETLNVAKNHPELVDRLLALASKAPQAEDLSILQNIRIPDPKSK
jgi:arylsulfatase A-like enzyme